jgi:hypothetical protein
LTARRGDFAVKSNLRVVLPNVALVARSDEVRRVVRAAAGERLDVIDHAAKVIEQRGPVTPPLRMVVGERPNVPAVTYHAFEVLQRRCENDRTAAPSTEPSVAAVDSYLPFLRQRRAGALRGGAAVLPEIDIRDLTPPVSGGTESHGRRAYGLRRDGDT